MCVLCVDVGLCECFVGLCEVVVCFDFGGVVDCFYFELCYVLCVVFELCECVDFVVG